MTPQDLFTAVIEECQPASLLAAGRHATGAARAWCRDHPDTGLAVLEPEASGELTGASARPHDLVVVSGTLDDIDARTGSLILGQLRNLGNRRIAVLVSNNSGWAFRDFIALGFVRQASVPGEQGHTLYTYNIATYNRKRDWNNPENWANPEMWDKARW